ncbi:hypothetical protein [Amycolatopsis anabasis]|uniref:hypothetical protein n=1 Tax=Amycolatopsis anabasis TaxID=1840409 RepID=UPI00131D6171|nr:hypothetical protein [Amycolatopsis anabasis]
MTETYWSGVPLDIMLGLVFLAAAVSVIVGHRQRKKYPHRPQRAIGHALVLFGVLALIFGIPLLFD